MAFPLSPANNQTALVNGIVYQWNAALGVWKRNGSINSASIGQLVLTSAQTSTSNVSGTLIVSGGAGITGNLYTGGIYITGANGITFPDGTVQTTAGVAVDAFARSTANSASSNTVVLQGVDTTQNTNITIATNAATAAFAQANATAGGLTSANTRLTIIEGVDVGQNTRMSIIEGVDTTQNSRITTVENLSSAIFLKANNAGELAQASFDTANTKLSSSGGTITGSLNINQDLTVTGNLTVLGNSTVITTNTLEIDDSLLYLAANNYYSDAVDIGLIAHYNDGANAHTGIFRDAILKEWIFFKGYTPEVESNNLINVAHPSFAYANVYAGHFKGNLITNGVDIYTYTSAAFTQANTSYNILDNYISLNNGINTTQNTNITAADAKAQAAFDAANTVSPLDSYARQTANAAFDKANSANVLAQAAFDKANTAAAVANAGAVLTSTVDTFTGNGSNTAFTLSTTPATINYTTAVVGGVTQPKSAYSVVGTTLTFTSAPANNQTIEVTTIGTSNTTLYTVNNIISPFLLMGA